MRRLCGAVSSGKCKKAEGNKYARKLPKMGSDDKGLPAVCCLASKVKAASYSMEAVVCTS
jgi:hypothetical protein